jgi:LacI family repressor for deo operon, udp, cdd, tsx, nupC, and nupG
VTLENFDALVSSVNLLAELGHTRIGFMRGLTDSDVGRDRHAGYVHGIQRNHLKLEEELIYNGDFSFESGRLGIKNFLDNGTLPTALICANDEMALGAIKELKKHNLRVPDDVSITGFDDIDVAGQVTPALTTLKAPTKDIAANALSLLNDLVTGKDIAQKSITLPCKMIVRETCSTPLKTSVKKTG